MNSKNAKFRLIFWSIVTVLLVSFLSNSLHTRNKLKSINFMEIKKDYSKKLEKINEYTVNGDKLESINIDLADDDIIFKYSEDKNIKIVESSNYKIDEDEGLQISEESKSTKIYRDKTIDTNDIMDLNGRLKKVEIYLPKEYNGKLDIKNQVGSIYISNKLDIDTLNISQQVGDLYIEDSIICNNFKATLRTGDIDIQNLKTGEYNIDLSVGNIDIVGISGEGKIKVGTGDIECGIDKIDGDISIVSKVGDVDLYLDNNLSFNLDARCSIGEIDNNFNANMKSEKEDDKEIITSIGNNPKFTIDVDSSVGDLNIDNK